METLGSVEYWKQELIRFREMMGNEDAWMTGRIVTAAKALIYCWLQTKKSDITESDKSLMEATMIEYDMRLVYMIFKMPVPTEN